MASRHLTLRVGEDTIAYLDAQSRRSGQTRSELARTLIEEGLRMETHPGIVFRPGPAGRRAGLASGPDVWEVMRVFRAIEASGEDPVKGTAEVGDLTPEQIRIALRYYADYSNEIDDWIARVEETARSAEAAWRREQELLGREAAAR